MRKLKVVVTDVTSCKARTGRRAQGRVRRLTAKRVLSSVAPSLADPRPLPLPSRAPLGDLGHGTTPLSAGRPALCRMATR